MCHIVMKNIKIKNPSKEVLRHAVENLAEKIGAKVSYSYVDLYGNKKEGFTLKKNRGEMGIGIIVEDGKIKIDKNLQTYSGEDIRRIKSGVEIEYISVATQEALREIGYIVQVEESDKEILITAGEGN